MLASWGTSAPYRCTPARFIAFAMCSDLNFGYNTPGQEIIDPERTASRFQFPGVIVIFASLGPLEGVNHPGKLRNGDRA